MAQHRYENLNNMPVIVPGKRGVGVTFTRGQWSTDPWFSRFCGPRQLTRVEITPTGVPIHRPAPAGQRPVPVVQKPLTPMKHALIVGAQENTPNWAKKDGIYYCKKCDLFRTGSKLAISNHLQSYHGLRKAELAKAQPVPVAPVVSAEPEPVVSAVASAVVRTPVVNGVLQDTVETFKCSHCGREYKSALGLEEHVEKEHSDGV